MMIIQCALQYAVKESEVNTVANDTDFLVLHTYAPLEKEHGK